MNENSLEQGLQTLFSKLGFSEQFIQRFQNGYPENSTFLNESLDCLRTLIQTFADADASTLELLQEYTNYDHENLTRASKTLRKYNQSIGEE